MLKDNLKAARLAARMTLDEVAQKVGVSRQTIQRYESGVIQNIPSDNIEKIANVLGVSPGVLMGWETSPNTADDVGGYGGVFSEEECAKGMILFAFL